MFYKHRTAWRQGQPLGTMKFVVIQICILFETKQVVNIFHIINIILDVSSLQLVLLIFMESNTYCNWHFVIFYAKKIIFIKRICLIQLSRSIFDLIFYRNLSVPILMTFWNTTSVFFYWNTIRRQLMVIPSRRYVTRKQSFFPCLMTYVN